MADGWLNTPKYKIQKNTTLDFPSTVLMNTLFKFDFLSEHLGLALALNVPVFVVVTKIDMCPANILQETMKLLTRILKSPGCRKIPLLVSSYDDVVVSATNFTSERYRDTIMFEACLYTMYLYQLYTMDYNHGQNIMKQDG